MSVKRTPEEFIQYYSEKLMEKFNNRGIQINKTGVIGFFMNLLGWTHYDLQNYYDTLFKEAFLYTAQTYENVIFRGAMYGYKPKFAKPAVASGTIEFNFDNVPVNPNATKTEVIFTSPTSISYYEGKTVRDVTLPSIIFSTEKNDLKFSSLCTYKFVKTIVNGLQNTYLCVIQDENLNVQQIPSQSSNIIAPLVNFYQYEVVEVSFKIPFYKHGSFYTYEIQLDADEHICDIEVYIKQPRSDVYEKYDVKYTKYFSTSIDQHVFFRWITFNKYAIDFGSGYYGVNVSNCDCYIIYKKTKGEYGNIGVDIKASKIYAQQCSIIYYDQNGNVISVTPFDLQKLTSIAIFSAEGGQNFSDIETFKKDVVNYIQTRDNLVSQNDFYNVVEKYLNDFEILFKKSIIFENTFYLYRIFRDKYQNPVYTKTYTVLKDDFTELYYPVFNINGRDYISPFYYKYNSMMRWYDSILVIDELVVYFEQAEEINKNYTDTIPVIYLKVIYDKLRDETTYYLKSYQDISGRTFVISIPILGVYNQIMEMIDNYTYSYSVNGITTEKTVVNIEEYSDNTLTTRYYKIVSQSFYQAYDVSDLVRLQFYKADNGHEYVINIPLIDKEMFESDKDYFYEQLIGYLVNLKLTENRMISDNLQARFFETNIASKLYHNTLLKQNYNFDIILPLKLKLTFKIDKLKVVSLRIDLNEEINEILNQVCDFILKNTGSSILIYNSRITDVILNENRKKYIKDVIITIIDSGGNILDQGLESIPLNAFLYNFNGTKLDVVMFTPIYWWFDINNIEVDTQME